MKYSPIFELCAISSDTLLRENDCKILQILTALQTD